MCPPRDENSNRPPEQLSHQGRIEAIHMSEIHGMSFRQIAKNIDTTYTTVRNIVYQYNRYGRTNKLLPPKSKLSIMELRNKIEVVAAEVSPERIF